jgi:hypothetical protein
MNVLKLLIPISPTAIVSVVMQTNTILTGGAVSLDTTTSRILLHIIGQLTLVCLSSDLRCLMTRVTVTPTTATRAHDIGFYILGLAFPSQIGINDYNDNSVVVQARVKFATLRPALTREKKS